MTVTGADCSGFASIRFRASTRVQGEHARGTVDTDRPRPLSRQRGRKLVISHSRFAVLLITLGLIQVRSAVRRGRLRAKSRTAYGVKVDLSAKMNFGPSKKLPSLI